MKICIGKLGAGEQKSSGLSEYFGLIVLLLPASLILWHSFTLASKAQM